MQALLYGLKKSNRQKSLVLHGPLPPIVSRERNGSARLRGKQTAGRGAVYKLSTRAQTSARFQGRIRALPYNGCYS